MQNCDSNLRINVRLLRGHSQRMSGESGEGFLKIEDTGGQGEGG